MPHTARLRAPRRSARCHPGISGGSGYLYLGRFDQAAHGVVVATVGCSRLVALSQEAEFFDEFELSGYAASTPAEQNASSFRLRSAREGPNAIFEWNAIDLS